MFRFQYNTPTLFKAFFALLIAFAAVVFVGTVYLLVVITSELDQLARGVGHLAGQVAAGWEESTRK